MGGVSNLAGNAGNTDKAAKRSVSSRAVPMVPVVPTVPEIPFNNLMFRLSMIVATAIVLETIVVGTATQLVVGMLTKAFALWIDAGAPGAN